jgi:hypothetical protein
MAQFLLPEWGYEILSYTFLIGAAAFTTWYPNHVRRTRHAQEQAPPSAPRQGNMRRSTGG